MASVSAVGVPFKEITSAIRNDDRDFILKHKTLIKSHWDNQSSYTSECWCGCQSDITLFNCLTANMDKRGDRTPVLKYLVEIEAIKPFDIFDSYDVRTTYIDQTRTSVCLLSDCLSNYAIWESDANRIDYLLSITPIKFLQDFVSSSGASLVHCLLSSHGYDDTLGCNSRRWCDLLMQHTNHLDSIYRRDNMEQLSFLNLAVQYMCPRLVKIALDRKQNPNLIPCNGRDEFFCKENIAMWLLHRSKYFKDPVWIQETIECLRLLVHNGLNLNYTTTDGRNLHDYIIRNGWNILSLMEIFKDRVLPQPTGKEYGGSGILFRKPDGFDEAKRILYENRFVKHPAEITKVSDEFKALSRIDFEHKDNIHNTIRYVSNYWHRSPIEDYILSLMP